METFYTERTLEQFKKLIYKNHELRKYKVHSLKECRHQKNCGYDVCIPYNCKQFISAGFSVEGNIRKELKKSIEKDLKKKDSDLIAGFSGCALTGYRFRFI